VLYLIKFYSMKKIFALGIFVLGLFMLNSCEQCATCSSQATDPNFSPDSVLTEEFCERGHVYNNQIETYERAGWDCTED